jgi:plastocyanin
MRLFFSFLFVLAFQTLAISQLTITEIMYNPPESGTDSLEYIELFNSSGQELNLEGYNFTQGIQFTFPRFLLEPEGYVVVAVDSGAMARNFGLTDVFEWESGGLSNGGEDIIIVDAQGNEADVVDYQNGGDWPRDANGDGPSLELCDVDRNNNDGASWKASESARGIVINGRELRGTPGQENGVSCADYTVEVTNNVFTPDTLVINVGETVEWLCTEGFHNVNGTLATYPDNPEGFGNGAPQNAPWSYSYTFNVPGEYDYQCDPHRLLGMLGHIVVQDVRIPDIVITEIMYNDPGADTLEFVEIFNNTMAAVDLTGYSFVSGIDAELDGVTIDAQSYLVFAAHPEYLLDQFGVVAVAYEGALNNDGEAIELVDPADRTVDRVVYDDRDPWDSRADEGGYSLILCDVNSDNGTGSNWSVSSNETNVVIERRPIFCSPGAPDTCETEGLEYPQYAISTVSTIDPLGFPDSIMVRCALQGVVHGVDLQGNDNLSFTIIDQSGGIGVFAEQSFNYTVTEGDEVLIKGVIDQFFGLTQIAADSLRVLSTGNSTVSPIDVTLLDETTESELVRIRNVSLVDPLEWEGDGSSFNVNVTDGNNIYNIRIDDDVDLASMPAPAGPFNVTGLGGQFDSSEPFLSGYQLLPRYMEDIDLISSTNDPSDRELTVFPNPVYERLFILNTNVTQWKVYDMDGSIMKVGSGQEVEMTDLGQGMYILVGQVPTGTLRARIVKP